MTDSPIGKYCGNTKPPNYTTMGNSLFMVLDSNTDGEYKVIILMGTLARPSG